VINKAGFEKGGGLASDTRGDFRLLACRMQSFTEDENLSSDFVRLGES
jgi:hypothetical protein